MRAQTHNRYAPSRDRLAGSGWQGPAGARSFYEASGAALAGLPSDAAYMQYRAVFSSPDGGEWPTLTEVEIQ